MHASSLLFLLTLSYPASAFYPTKFRPNLAFNPGISHEQITEEAFDIAAAELFPRALKGPDSAYGRALPRGMLAARTEIAKACALADKEKNEKAWHFDDEDLEAGKGVLGPLKWKVLRALRADDVHGARKGLGEVLHIVQDIYGHDAEKVTVDAELAERNRVPFAGSMAGMAMMDDEMNDQEYRPVYGRSRLHAHRDSRANMRVDNNPPESDTEADIKKQTNLEAHLKAVESARDSSVGTIKGLADVISPRDFQRIFGLSLDTLVVLDPALRHSEEWPHTRKVLRSTLESLISDDTKTETHYVGVRELSSSFELEHDPLLSGWTALRTPADLDFIDGLYSPSSTLSCSRVGPEILNARIQELVFGGEVTLIVAQPLRVDDISNEHAADFLSKYPVTVNVVQLKSTCSMNEEIDSNYQSIASLSGGYAITDTTSLQTLRPERDESDVLGHQLSPIITRNNMDPSKPFSLEFHIEEQAEQLVLTVDCDDCATFTILGSPSSDPEPGPDPIVLKRDGKVHRIIFTVNYPEPGTWRTNFTSTGIFNASIQSRGPIQLVDFYLAENAGREGHHGFFPIQGTVLADTNVGLIGELSGNFKSAHWSLVDTQTGVETELNMLSGLDSTKSPGYGDTHTFGTITKLPAKSFYVVVRGEDSNGSPFQKMFPQTISPESHSGQSYDLGGAERIIDRRSDLETATLEGLGRERLPFQQEQNATTTAVVTTTAATTAGTSTFFNGLTTPGPGATDTSLLTVPSSTPLWTNASFSVASTLPATTNASSGVETAGAQTAGAESVPTNITSAGTTVASASALNATGSPTSSAIATEVVTEASTTAATEISTSPDTTVGVITGTISTVNSTSSESSAEVATETSVSAVTAATENTTSTAPPIEVVTETVTTLTSAAATEEVTSVAAATATQTVSSSSSNSSSTSTSTTSVTETSSVTATNTTTSISSTETVNAVPPCAETETIIRTKYITGANGPVGSESSVIGVTIGTSAGSPIESAPTELTKWCEQCDCLTTHPAPSSPIPTPATTSLVPANASKSPCPNATPEKYGSVQSKDGITNQSGPSPTPQSYSEPAKPEATSAVPPEAPDDNVPTGYQKQPPIVTTVTSRKTWTTTATTTSTPVKLPPPSAKVLTTQPCDTAKETGVAQGPYGHEQPPTKNDGPAPSITAASNATYPDDGNHSGKHDGGGKTTDSKDGPSFTGDQTSTGTASASATDDGARGVRAGVVVVVVVALGGMTFLML